MPKASLYGVTLTESDHTQVVEGRHYLYPGESDARTVCLWEGEAGYYSVEVDSGSVEDTARYYPEPKGAARNIEDHAAFYGNEVRIEE